MCYQKSTALGGLLRCKRRLCRMRLEVNKRGAGDRRERWLRNHWKRWSPLLESCIPARPSVNSTKSRVTDGETSNGNEILSRLPSRYCFRDLFSYDLKTKAKVPLYRNGRWLTKGEVLLEVNAQREKRVPSKYGGMFVRASATPMTSQGNENPDPRYTADAVQRWSSARQVEHDRRVGSDDTIPESIREAMRRFPERFRADGSPVFHNTGPRDSRRRRGG